LRISGGQGPDTAFEEIRPRAGAFPRRFPQRDFAGASTDSLQRDARFTAKWSGWALHGDFRSGFLRVADHPDHCRSGPLESPHQSVEPACGFVEAFEHVDLAVAGGQTRRESVAVRMKADAPGQDGVRRRIQRGELLLDAGFDIDRDQPLNGVLRRRVPVKIERNERQRCLIKNAGSWGLWSRAEPAETAESLRRDHRPAVILSHY
jgi:hypothetical protein